jgi:hypothetical protein
MGMIQFRTYFLSQKNILDFPSAKWKCLASGRWKLSISVQPAESLRSPRSLDNLQKMVMVTDRATIRFSENEQTVTQSEKLNYGMVGLVCTRMIGDSPGLGEYTRRLEGRDFDRTGYCKADPFPPDGIEEDEMVDSIGSSATGRIRIPAGRRSP